MYEYTYSAVATASHGPLPFTFSKNLGKTLGLADWLNGGEASHRAIISLALPYPLSVLLPLGAWLY